MHPATPEAIAAAAAGYANLQALRQKHFPWLLNAGGAALFFTLARAAEPIPTADLYCGAGTSRPRVRKMIAELRQKGFVTITVDPKDRRRAFIEPTDLFRRLARCYVQMMTLLLST